MAKKGFKWTRKKVYGGAALALVFLALLGSLAPNDPAESPVSEATQDPAEAQSGEAEPEPVESASAPVEPTPTPEATEPSKAWHEYPKINKETTAEWLQATDEVKLATCGELIAKARAAQVLTPDIQSQLTTADDILPLAKELRVEMDKAIAPLEGKSEVLSLEEVAVLAMVNLGWTADRLQ